MNSIRSRNIERVGHLDIPGGGQVVVQGEYAFVGHMAPPLGTSIINVSDPSHPEICAQIRVPAHTHSHKVRVFDNIMLVNSESFGKTHTRSPGLRIFDITTVTAPCEIGFFKTGGKGVHRFTCDRHYAYISTEMEGYVGAISMIVDISDPSHPKEVSRWWLPGQHAAGNEKPAWEGTRFRTHHPLRLGNRIYVGLWFGGFAIVDIEDIQNPRTVHHYMWDVPPASPTHTTLPLETPIKGKQILVVCEEAVSVLKKGESPTAHLHLFDITDEQKPEKLSTHTVLPNGLATGEGRFGAHQPWEGVRDSCLYVAWFGGGLRIIDIADPVHPREITSFVPMPPSGTSMCASNDVFVDTNGLIYLIDRNRGLDILALQ
jgi:hypothetical protein